MNEDGARKQLVQFFEAWGAPMKRPWMDESGCRSFCFRESLIA